MHVKTILALAMSALMILSATGITGVLADEASGPAGIENSSTVVPIKLELEDHIYYPNDIVRIYIYNASEPLLSITDPSNTTVSVPVSRHNDSAFLGEYALDHSIILGNYTVKATDNATGAAAGDTFEVTTRQVVVIPAPTVTPDNTTVEKPPLYLYINVSKTDYTPGQKAGISVETNAGKPTLAIQDPANNTAYPELQSTGENTYSAAYGLDKAVVLGNYTALAYVNENGTYCYAMAGFSVTMGKKTYKGMRIQYAAYDPVQKAIVLRANVAAGSSDTVATVKSDPAVKGMAVKSVKVLQASGVQNAPADTAKEDKMVDVLIPVDKNNVDSVVSQYNLTPDITKAMTSVAVNAKGTNIHLSLNNKVDGCWYRLSAGIPAGYNVIKIVRVDGTEIMNNVTIDRSTGEIVSNDVNWYVDNGTLYFYDDPINGYDITLLPPVASYSLAVNVVNGGQLSAIVYPFNQSDPAATIAANDHLGYAGDNSYATNIDADAGSKTGVRMYQNNSVSTANRLIFGNNGMNYHTYSNANYQYTDNGQPAIVGFNTVPDGSVESVVISSYVTPMAGNAPSYVNITQKTIIRNNNLWFATVYYITNAGGSDISSLRFYEGCDFNFNGNYQGDDDFYDSTNDSVYGYKNNANANSIHVGGFRSPLLSSAHDESQYGTMWNDISSDSLNNASNSATGVDGGMALAWDRATLKKGDTWAVPVIWGVGQNTTVYNTNLNYAVGHNVYDVGIKSVDTPLNGDSLDALTTPIMTINATAMDLGVTDQTSTVYLRITNSSGGVVYNTSTTVALSLPYQETAPVSFNWNLTGVPSGTYNVSVYTQLAGDQNSSNDLKSITVYVQSFSLYPDQWVHANPGDNVLFPLNLSNLGAQRTFNLSISQATAGWASNLYYNNTSILLANDTNGDGTWDWVNASYRDPVSGLPAITVAAAGKAPFILQKLVPAAADTGILDTVTLMAYSGQPSTNSSAVLKTDTPLAAMANKTFYLHNLYLNTTPEPAATGNTPITSIFSMWGQVPVFADSFMISGNVSVPVYYTTTTAMPITATLFYTNGAGSSVLIGSNTSTIAASASQATPSLFNFTITQAGSNVTVPRGSYLVLKIDNQQTTAFNVWYTNAYRSRVDVKTPTYVHVGNIITYNGTVPASSFNPGDTVYVTANVTDPIGVYDIVGATISVTAPNGSYIVNNQSMALNKTDVSVPALWKLYNYSYKLDGSLPAGVYGINITGYESNGVIYRKNVSITLMAGAPAVQIYPNITKVSAPSTVVYFKHSVTNLNAYRSDVADILYDIPNGWSVSLFKADGMTVLPDTNGNGIQDTDTLSPLGSVDIVLKVTVPAVSQGNAYFINVTARSSQDRSVSSTARDTVFVATTSAIKTLYLHDNVTLSQFMNTSSNNSVNDHTDIASGGTATWSQSPAFARDFNILDDPMLTLYAASANSNINMSVSIISWNSTSSAVIGSIIYQTTVTVNTNTKLSFNVSLYAANVTIPKGNQLLFRINNLNSNKLTISESAQYPSHIDMNTLSYINVNGVTVYDSGNNVITGMTPPSTVKVVANVTDPFGSFDISDVSVQLQYPNGTIAMGQTPMNLSGTDSSTLSMWKLFERNITLNNSLDTGSYVFLVSANESNGVKNNLSAQLAISYPVNVTASKSYSSAGGSNFNVIITLKNNDNHTISGVHAYDFYAIDFTAGGFSQPRNVVSVNNALLQGNINVFGPFQLSPSGVVTITYVASGVGDYKLSNMTIIGVDPDV